jgi:U3 small nucleolar RNA-associated protein 13
MRDYDNNEGEMDYEDQDGEAFDDQQEEVIDPAANMAAPTLSKTWAVKAAHVPTFTGGKITHCHGKGIYVPVAPKGPATATDESDEDPSELPTPSSTPFLLLPVGGDVAVVDAARGVKMGTVRGKDAPLTGGADDDGEEEDGIDADAVTAYSLSGNDQIILTCSHNSLIRQYAVREPPKETTGTAKSVSTKESSSPIQFIKTWGKSGHTLPVTEIEFHRSNIFAATGSVDGSVRVWDVRGAYVTHVFRAVSGGTGGSGTLAVTSVRWLNDAQQLILAIGRDDGSIVIHNLRHPKDPARMPIAVLREHVSAVTCMEWNEKANVLVTTGRDAVINLWKVTATTSKSPKGKKKQSPTNVVPEYTYQRLHTLPVYEQLEGMVLLPSHMGPNELVLATAGSKGHVRLWKADLATEGKAPALELMAEQPKAQSFGEARGGYMHLRYNPFGRPKATTSEDQSDFVQEQLIVADAEHNISFLSLADDPKNFLTSDRTIVGHNDDILDLKIIPSPDGVVNRIAVATNSAQVRLFDLSNFSCDVLDRHTGTVLCVDVSPCGRYLATCGKDKQMRIWHLASRKSVAVALGHTEAVGSTALSRKAGRYDVRGKAATNGGGAFVVTVSMDRTLKRWNLPGAADLDECAEKDEEHSLKAFVSARAHEKDINIVSVAPNDSLIATGSQDKTVKLWRATDLSLKATLKGHRRGVWDCQFSPFDRVLATGSGDRTIKLWSLGDFSCVRTFQGHVASVLRVRFLSGGLQLVSSGGDGLVKLWTIRTNECETTLDGHDNKVWALDLAAGGKELVSGGADSQLVVWEDTTKEVESAKLAEEEEAILMDQRLANHLRHKEYGQALELSLERDKPRQSLKVLTSIVEGDLQKGQDGLVSLKKHAKAWSIDRVTQVLKYCREWNTRARNSQIALLVIKSIVTTWPAHKLAAADGVPEILAGILPYAERHFDRLDRLYASSYLLDFALFAMGSLDAAGAEEEFAAWESKSKLVLPPTYIDGRVQVGGKALVGHKQNTQEESDDEDDVVTIGDSDSSEDEQ